MVAPEAMVCLVFRFHHVMHLSTSLIVQMQAHLTMEVKNIQTKISKNKSNNSNKQSTILLETRTSTNHCPRLRFHLKFAFAVLLVDLIKILVTSAKVNTQFKLKGLSIRNSNLTKMLKATGLSFSAKSSTHTESKGQQSTKK